MNLVPQEPFGLVVELPEGTPFGALPPDDVLGWVREHKLVVIRGVGGLSKRTLPLAARRLGPLQPWSFGAVNVLRVDREKKNYLFTGSSVPLHWDGAFKGEIPQILMFHCIEAPPPDAGGATVFVDAEGVWSARSPDEQASWRRAGFRYDTERVVHYGGTFTSPLVGRHPHTGREVLRFAEPVRDLNPVEVTALHPGSPTVDEVATALADPAHVVRHVWRDGDVVLADNHGLLHGRDAFVEQAPRWIHRVNVLDPDRTWRHTLADSLRIRRPEFMVAEIPINLLALLWIAPDAAWLGSLAYWEASLVMLLLFHFGDMVNCLADRELDAVYKTRTSEAVLGLGVRNVTAQIAVTAGLAGGLTVHLAAHTGQWALVPLVAVGLLLGHQYSYGPWKLKSAGLVQLPALWGVIFVGPMLLMTLATVGLPSVGTLALIGLYGALAQSVILVNTAEDFDEDVENGLVTSAVALGRVGALRASAAGVFLFGGALLALLAWDAASGASGARWYALGLWTSAWSWTTLEIAHLAWRVDRSGTPDAELKRGAAKMPVWLTVLAWLTLLVVAVRAAAG